MFNMYCSCVYWVRVHPLICIAVVTSLHLYNIVWDRCKVFKNTGVNSVTVTGGM